MATTLNLFFDPVSEKTLANCSNCLQILAEMTEFLTDNARIMIGDQPGDQKLTEWVKADTENRFFQVIYANQIILTYDGNFNVDDEYCNIFENAFAGLEPCDLTRAQFTVEATDKTTNPVSFGTGEFAFTLQASEPPEVESNLISGLVFCGVPTCPATEAEIQANTTASPNFNPFGKITVTTNCRSARVSCFVEKTNQCKDCDGENDEFCQRFTYNVEVQDECNNEVLNSVDFFVLGTSLCLPTIDPCIEVGTKTPIETTQAVIDENILKLKNETKDSCGRMIDSDKVQVEWRSSLLCNRCCRGEFLNRVTYEVTATPSALNPVTGDLIDCRSITESIVQEVRVFDPSWEKYFPSLCPCECQSNEQPI